MRRGQSNKTPRYCAIRILADGSSPRRPEITECFGVEGQLPVGRSTEICEKDNLKRQDFCVPPGPCASNKQYQCWSRSRHLSLFSLFPPQTPVPPCAVLGQDQHRNIETSLESSRVQGLSGGPAQATKSSSTNYVGLRTPAESSVRWTQVILPWSPLVSSSNTMFSFKTRDRPNGALTRAIHQANLPPKFASLELPSCPSELLGRQ